MTKKIKLVRGDTKPHVKVVVRDDETKEPINVSGGTVRLLFRKAGESALQATVTGTLLAGMEDEDGNVSTAPPYDVAGYGGRVAFPWADGDLDCEPGQYEGEIKVTFSDSTRQTVFELLKFEVRSALGE